MSPEFTIQLMSVMNNNQLEQEPAVCHLQHVEFNVPADILAPLGAKASVGPMMTRVP